MKIEVKHTTRTIIVDLPETATFAEFKAALAKETKVPASMQKLMGKVSLKGDDVDSKTLGALGFKEGAKMMLIGNPVEDVVNAHGNAKANEEKRAREVRNLPGNFWSLPPFAGMLADPYVEGRGRPVEDGTAALSLLLMDVAMSRINTLGTNLATLAMNDDAANSLDHPFLKLTSKERAILARAHAVLLKSLEFTTAASNAKEPEEVMILVQTVINNIKGLPDNEWLLIPSGWVNLQNANVMYLLIKKNAGKPSTVYTADGSGDSYDMVVVNTDPSELGCLDFHPQMPTSDKLKAKACMLMPCVSKERLLDEAFWLLMLSLWVRANDPEAVSEFARGEVIYDVLLPWLYEIDPSKAASASPTTASSPTAATAASLSGPTSLPRDLSALFANPDQYTSLHTALAAAAGSTSPTTSSSSTGGNFITPQRSRSGSTKALLAAFAYLLQQFGMSEGLIKQLKFTLKYEFFTKAAEDLLVCGKRHLSFSSGVPTTAAAASPNSFASSSSPTSAATGAVTTKKATPSSSAATSSPTTKTTTALPAKAKRLSDAIEVMEKMGIEASSTNPSLSALFDAMGPRDVVKTNTNVLLQPSHFDNKVVAVYFTGSWCAPCRKFSPLVIEVYDRLMERIPDAKTKIEFLLVSVDRKQEEYDEYSAKFPFPRMSWPPDEKVMKAFDVSGVPTLIIFAPDGSMMTRDGVAAVRNDPEATKFPNAPWNGAVSLTSTDIKMFEYAAATLSHHALKKYDAVKSLQQQNKDVNLNNNGVGITETQLESIRNIIVAVKSVVDAMPHRTDDGEESSLFEEDEEKEEGRALVKQTEEGTVDTEHTSADGFGILTVPDSAAHGHNSGLLNRVSTVKYAGTPFTSTVPSLGDLSHFKVPWDYTMLHQMLRQALKHVESLWDRSRHSGTSSRVAVQMQIIEFISWLFTFIIPIPKPSRAQISAIQVDALPPSERPVLEQFLREDHNPIRDSVTSDLYSGAIPQLNNNTTTNNNNTADGGAAAPANNANSNGEDAQFQMCEAIYKLMLSYVTAWQAVETPSRAFDSERALVSVAMLCVYDAIARTVEGSNRGLILSILLTTDAGGYHMSTSLCKNTRAFKDVSATFELTKPQHLAVRDALITLITFNQLRYPNELFDLRVPDHVELRKHSHTVNFLRRFLENCGYRLGGGEDDDDANNNNNGGGRGRGGRGGGMMGRTQAQQMGGSEMEKLMFWMCDARSPMATEHPEFGMLRDMALLTKFMATMEMRDAQLLRKRKEFDEFASWRLSFEEDAPGRQMSAGWRTRPRAPFWDCLIVRGRDMDIADISVKGFGDRSISAYGEGLCVVSPIDVSAQLGVEHPLEEDVLHAKSLPTFGGVLSQEEAEALWAILTVPYMRIPLVLDFFSTQDRHTYLFAGPMQTLLRATLFEPGAHIPLSADEYNKKFNVPMRLNRQQKQEAHIAVTMSATAEGDTTRFLGTTFGLLLNELQHSPQPVLGPWLRILQSTRDLGPSSVYSVNATYVLFLCAITCDILSFINYALTMNSDDFYCRHSEYLSESRIAIESVLQELVCPLLNQWLAEAEENDDIPTQCVVHSHLAMTHRALSLGKPQGDDSRKLTLVKLLQSCAFVRARHGFGMGFQRTQLASQDGDNALSPEEKLLRFLQAQGLDTRSTNREMLEQGRKLMMSGGRRRAVFVQIRGRNHSDTVRVPNLFKSDPTSTAESKALKLPPVDVPENLLFSILQEHFFELSSFVLSLPTEKPSNTTAVATLAASSAASLSALPAVEITLDNVANAIVKTILKDKVALTAAAAAPQSPTTPKSAAGSAVAASGEGATWVRSAAGVLAAPASSLVFHLQTCELFWKDEELKPVPDSMSHYDDYETILGRDIVQCGLVSRSEHRHWVHVVGTAYDLVEWTEHDPNDQGIHCPAILIGPPQSEKIEHVSYLGQSYTRVVNVYDEDPWPEKAERWAVKLVQQIYQAAFPQPGSMKYSPIMPEAVMVPQQPQRDHTTNNGGMNRKQVLSDSVRMLCFDKEQYDGEDDHVKATWKEIIATRQTTVRPLPPNKSVVIPGPYDGFEVVDTNIRVDIFTLVPHARRMYRVLHFSTSQRGCLAALELIKSKRIHNEYFKTLRYQVGRLKNRIKNEGTLEIHRYNKDINGREVYIPPRLLQGVVPSSLLENLLFWHGEDDIIRGYPGNSGAASAAIASAATSEAKEVGKKGGKVNQVADADDAQKKKDDANAEKRKSDDELAKAAGEAFANHWFNYSVEIELGPGHQTNALSKKHADTGANGLPMGHFRLIRRADKRHRKIRETPSSRRKGEATAASTATAAAADATGMGARTESEVVDDVSAQIDAKSLSTLRTVFSEYPDTVLIYAFKQAKRNVGKTVDWLADPANSDAIHALMPPPTPPPSANDNDNVNDATEGSASSSPTQRKGGMPPRAGSSLMNGGSTSDMSAMGRTTTFGGEGDEVEQVTEENLELLRLTDCAELSHLAQLLTRVEDASHILVWGRRRQKSATEESDNATTNNTTADSFYEIQIIEFPRLRAKFQPKVEEDGRTINLWLVDNPGWRVALPSEIFCDDRVVTLMDPWEQCIVMRNVTTSEMAFFVPNHDFARMDVHGDAFNRLLLFDRGSVQWMESVPSPFYLFTIHTSRAFLIAPSLAASLYAAVILTARQRYAEAFRYVEACYVDTAFTVEEQFMFALMARTLTSASGSGKDNHPDAHAARLKFAHAALYSPNEVEWNLEAEVSRYLLKHQHVSRCCRLTREELTDLLKSCRRATSIIKCQLEYWVQQAQGKSNAKIVPPPIEKAGRPWAKLKAMPLGAVTNTCSKITRLQFKDPPQLLHEKALIEWLWEDKLLQDEESGANTSTGFYFLYSVLRKRPQTGMKFLGKDVTATMGVLLSRWFQLRHARWGKEFSGSGESQFVPSYMMVCLADLESFPNAAWPQLTDPSTIGYMSRGGISVNQQINTANNRMWGRMGGGGGGGDEDFYTGQQRGPTPLAIFARDLERCVQDIHRRSAKPLPTYRNIDRVSVKAYDFIVPRVMPTDTAQDAVIIRGSQDGDDFFSHRTASSMATFLFEEIDIFEKFVTVREPSSSAAADDSNKSALPFDIAQHPLAQSHVAVDMLRRLEGDVNTFEKQRRTTTQYLLKMLDNTSNLFEPLWSCSSVSASSAASVGSAIQTISESLRQLIAALTHLNASDSTAVKALSQKVLGLANGVHTPPPSATASGAVGVDEPPALQALLHELHCAAGSRNAMTIEWLCGALLSSNFAADISAVNPLHGDLDTLQRSLIIFMLLSNRSYFGAQTIGAAQQLLRFMEMVRMLGEYLLLSTEEGALSSGVSAAEEALVAFAAFLSVDHDTNLSGKEQIQSIALAMKGRFMQLTGTLSEQIAVSRHYVSKCNDAACEDDNANSSSSDSYVLDPRFLSFEFIFSIILRKRQVEMIRWFKSSIDKGQSHVQQMIMGQGKTTVVGPLLALMLADGKTLVTQVMPTALLEQSRNVLRRCFSVIIPKRIFTLQFDRSVEDSEEVVESLFQKLQSALKNRSIVVSAPESIKALFLKYIEQLHALESTPEADLLGTSGSSGVNGGGGSSSRKAREVRLIKNKAIARSKMADAIVPILHMWRSGVLIMDEVDVLLHPLRSELNFPIGLKHPIDLSGARWLLPMHIIDGIFFASKGRVSGTLAAASSSIKGLKKHGEGGQGAAWKAMKAKLGGGADDEDDNVMEDGNVATMGADTHHADEEAEELACLENLRGILHEGIVSHTIQREPHIVLLDNAFYHHRMKAAVAKWAVLWLWRTIAKEQAKAKRLAERQAQLAALSKLQQQVVMAAAGGNTGENDNATAQEASAADAPNLNITKDAFFAIAESFLLESRGMSSSSHSADGYAALLSLGHSMSTNLLPHAIQLLFLARDWLDTLLPHVLAKINRVGYGILQANDLASLTSSSQQQGGGNANHGMPLSRRLMAIPFVAKDVPSRSSEFAHPDVVIGLTILAYRYEGLRKSDVKELLLQLKQDYSRQTGPRERRPAAILFNAWLTKARADRERLAKSGSDAVSNSVSTTTTTATDDAYASVPLSQLQVLDPTQLNAVYNTLRTLPEAAHYYLCQHTFPRTMNFQRLKLSACGHELASSILFGKRIGFSGTPSNLLPLDMGACEYEPGSDGKILNVLTDPTITTCEELEEGWSPLKVLRQIATANPPYHALIDTGALITNMDNEQVARYLIEHLPHSFEGVVFLDAKDRQVVLQRNNMQIVPLTQCGVALSRRFTFFDQVHTTGMDIKQSPTATAVVTIGKDMVFRDYAQGAFRMRGIGKGQKIKLFLIPEVVARVKESLVAFDSAAATKSNAINIPAWLLLNAMRIEGLQYVKLSSQELENIWRKLALKYLVIDSRYANTHKDLFTDLERVRRFGMPHASSQQSSSDNVNAATSAIISGSRDTERGPVNAAFLSRCIASFREIIGFPVPDAVEAPISYANKVQQHFDEKPRALLVGPTNEDGTSALLRVGSNGDDEYNVIATNSREAMRMLASGGDVTSGRASSEMNIMNAVPAQPNAEAVERIAQVMQRMLTALDVHSGKGGGEESADAMGLNAEVVHEQEAEEEQEQEAEQEEQRVSAFTRDDEQQIGWDVRVINRNNGGFARGEAVLLCTSASPSSAVQLDSPFYPCASFQVRPEQPKINIPSYLTLSDNFYRKRWAGLGERKLRNCVVFVQWILEGTAAADSASKNAHTAQGSVITLAEAETLRWLLHHNNSVQSAVPVSIRIVGSGRYVEASTSFRRMLLEATAPTDDAVDGDTDGDFFNTFYAAECRRDFLSMEATTANATTAAATSSATVVASSPQPSASPLALSDPIALWFRFFNNDMFYTSDELHIIDNRLLKRVSLPDRVAFFMECLRLRRRHRNDFEDAPIAELFIADEDRDELKDIAELKKLEVALIRFAKVPTADTKDRANNAANPDFMTEEEQLQMLLISTAQQHHDDTVGEASSSAAAATASNVRVSPFMATLRSLIKRKMTSSPSSSSAASDAAPQYFTAAEVSAIVRDAMLTSVRESVANAKQQKTSKHVDPTANTADLTPSGDEGSTAAAGIVRLPSSLSSIDLGGAMARVQSMLLERALHEAARIAVSDNSNNSNGDHTMSASTNNHNRFISFDKLSYEGLIDVLPVLHTQFEAIEEAKAAAAKTARKEAKRQKKEAKRLARSGANGGDASSLAPWNCPTCTFQNEGRVINCAICLTDRPAGFGPAPTSSEGGNAGDNDGDDSSDGEEDEKPPMDWNCPACTFLNGATVLECGICNTANPNPPKKKSEGGGNANAGGGGGAHAWEREVPEGVWICSTEHGGCSMYNPDNWYYCKACDKARPNLASMRF